MHSFFNVGIVMVGAILVCCGWLVLMFLRAWDYWDVADKAADVSVPDDAAFTGPAISSGFSFDQSEVV